MSAGRRDVVLWAVCLTLSTLFACGGDGSRLSFGEGGGGAGGSISSTTSATTTSTTSTSSSTTTSSTTTSSTSSTTGDAAAPPTCGDGKKDGSEVCDGADLGGATCQSLGYAGGTLACASSCASFDTSGCTAPVTCGNGTKDPGEVCDGVDLGGATCTSLGYGPGALTCASDCASFDTSGCSCLPVCGSLVCGPDPVCGASCGTCAVTSVCQAGACVRVCDLPPIQASETLNIDVPMVTIGGAITLNGAAMPDDAILDGVPRGSIQLRNVDTLSVATIPLGEEGAVSYSVRIFAGTYDVLVLSNGATYQSVLPDAQEGLVIKGLSLTASGIQNIDVKMVAPSGAITLNGAAIPDDTLVDGVSRGSVELRNVDTLGVTTVDLKETGPVSYALRMFAGTYDVLVVSNGATYQSVLPDASQGLVVKALSLTTSGTQNFDVKMVAISGSITLNGAAMPNDAIVDGVPRGSVQLRNVDTLSVATLPLGETGAVSYSLRLFAGAYDVLVISNGATYQSVLPDALKGLVTKGLSLTTSGTQDFDVKMVAISGSITLNGAALPNDTIVDGVDRGSVELRDVDTLGVATLKLGETGPVSYSLKLFAGAYDVLVLSNGATYQSVLPDALQGLVTKGLSITASGTQNIDVKMVTVSGAITLNGAAMPNDTVADGVSRGSVELQNADTLSVATVNLGETGAVSYSLRLFGGTYDVLVLSNGATHQSVLPDALKGLVTKGLSITASGTENIDVKMATVSGAITLNGAAMPSDTIVDGVPRGTVELRDVDTLGVATINLGETGPVSYSMRVFGGTYDVLALSNGATYQSVLPDALQSRIEKGCSP